jgi:hypothetical protein
MMMRLSAASAPFFHSAADPEGADHAVRKRGDLPQRPGHALPGHVRLPRLLLRVSATLC